MKKPVILLLIAATIASAIYLSANPQLFTQKAIGYHNEEEDDDEEGEEMQSGAAYQLSGWFQAKAYPNPENLNEKYQKAWEQYLEIRNNTAIPDRRVMTEGLVSNWTSLGDVSNIGGRVLCVEVDPGNSNTVWAGSASGGIWKSVNGGTSWVGVPTNMQVLGVASIIVDPSNSNIIYAGTGEVYRVDTSNSGFNVWKTRGTYGIGIIKSTDGGATWSQVMTKTSGQMFAIQMLKFQPGSSSIIYACATDGLYKSTDSGTTWNQVLSKIYVSDVCINPSNTDQVVVGVGNMVNLDKGIYRTTNASNATPTWSKISSNLPSAFSGYIRLDNVGSTRLYAAVAGTSGNELYLSTDFGANWSEKNGSAHVSFQYWFAHTLAINPSNTSDILCGGVDFYRYTSTNTTTGGSIAGIGASIHSDHHDIEYDPNNSNTIYVACDGGVYKSTDGGANWNAINTGLRATQFYAPIGVHPTNANIIIGGLQDNGVVRYNGTSWLTVFGGDGGPSAIAPNGTSVLASNDARRVRVSTTGVTGGFGGGLASWAFTADDRTAFMAPVAISKSDGNYMYAASDNIHRSTDGGANWTNTTTSSTNYIDAFRKTAISLAVSPTNRNKIYVSTSNIAQNTANDYLWVNELPDILKSTSPSTTPYTSIKGTLPDRFVMDFAISQNSDDSVYIVLGGFGTSHVYLTPDGGTTWLSRGSGLPDVPFNAILIDPTNPNIIYAGCDFGVYASNNRGVNWYDYNTGFYDATLVMDLQVDANNKLIAATHGKGVFRSDLFTPPVTLPVNFTSFTGQNVNTVNELKWDVEEEYNLSHYNVERSLDGFNFQTIGKVTARNITAPSAYYYNDNIRNIAASSFYYRLKAFNADGTYFYSDIIQIRIVNKSTFKIIGNPFTEQISFRYTAAQAGTMQVRLSDQQGRLLRKQQQQVTTGTAYYTINNLSSLPAGMYILELWINKERYVEKILRQ